MSLDEEKIESELRGTTLRVYWYVLRQNRKVGVREVQRALRLSSPSVASHHLEKLMRLGLLEKAPTGEYTVQQTVQVGFMRLFLRLGRYMLPRHLFYAVFFTSMLIGYLILYFKSIGTEQFLLLTSLGSSCAIFWYETARILREAPF
ncbi:MAG: hypothetical protein QXI32_03490 [Candidatus Bathyarchaeia archaeon]